MGLLFAIMALVYCLLTSPVGMICTRMGLHNCLALGFVIESVGYVMLVPPSSWGVWFANLPGREHAAMVVNGLGAAFSYVPIYPALLRVRVFSCRDSSLERCARGFVTPQHPNTSTLRLSSH